MEVNAEVSSWIRKNAVPLKDVTAGVGLEDLARLRGWIGDARVVGLGEATHGTREFFQLKHRMLEFLVADMGFTLFTIEADFPQSLAINRYVLTGEGDASHSLSSMRYWDCEEVLELIEWMRQWNAEHERKVSFYGVDVQSTASVIFLLEYVQRHTPRSYGRLRDALLRLTNDANSFSIEWWMSLSDMEKKVARSAIADLTALLAELPAATAEDRFELEMARLHAVVLRQNERLWTDASLRNVQSVRDRAMADNISALLQLHGPDSKAVVWGHNIHVQLRPGDPWGAMTPPMGQHLREKFRDRYVTFGFAFDHGSFEAADATGRKREWTVDSVSGTLDAALAEAGYSILALDLRDVPSGVANWFAQSPPSRCIGGGYDPSWEKKLWTHRDVRTLYDALLFVRKTSAARPTVTAYEFELRREGSPAPEGLVNLDFSAGTQGWQMRRQPTVGAYKVGVVCEQGRRLLEISRSESLWPWDDYTLLQTASAGPWRGRRITVRCPVSMAAAHHGSSAQLAVRVLRKRSAQKGPGFDENFDDLSEGGWIKRLAWQRVATRDSEMRELSLTTQVDDTADTIGVALVITGDGCARFGSVTIGAGDDKQKPSASRYT